MKPAHKAKILIATFYQFASDEETTEDGYIYSDLVQFNNAKECALISVKEIIKSRREDSHFDDTLSSTGSEYYTPHPMYLTYWLQVKQEIEKL